MEDNDEQTRQRSSTDTDVHADEHDDKHEYPNLGAEGSKQVQTGRKLPSGGVTNNSTNPRPAPSEMQMLMANLLLI